MSIVSILQAIDSSGLSVGIRKSLLIFPMLEALHVMALGLVFGTIVVVDLRLLGLASTERSFDRVSHDMLKWTWAAFAMAALTGTLMFTSNAQVYFENPFFRAKAALLALAGINMLVFQFTIGRSSDRWGGARKAPTAGRVAAVISIAVWLGVIGMGRAIGFSTTGAAAKEAPPPPANVNFDDFLAAGPSDAPAPPSPAPGPSK